MTLRTSLVSTPSPSRFQARVVRDVRQPLDSLSKNLFATRSSQCGLSEGLDVAGAKSSWRWAVAELQRE